MGHLGHDAGDDRHVQLEEFMSHPLMQEGDHGRIAKDDLAGTLSRRIAVHDRFHVGREQMLHVGQPINEVECDLLGAYFCFRSALRLETESVVDLLLQ